MSEVTEHILERYPSGQTKVLEVMHPGVFKSIITLRADGTKAHVIRHNFGDDLSTSYCYDEKGNCLASIVRELDKEEEDMDELRRLSNINKQKNK